MCSLGRGGTLCVLLEMQGPSSAKGSCRDEGGQDLVKARIPVEASQLLVTKQPSPSRLSVGRLSKALEKRLDLVEPARLEERSQQTVHCNQLKIALKLFAQRRRCQSVSQEVQPLLAVSLVEGNVSESNARSALYRDETVRFCDGACAFEVPGLGMRVYGLGFGV